MNRCVEHIIKCVQVDPEVRDRFRERRSRSNAAVRVGPFEVGLPVHSVADVGGAKRPNNVKCAYYSARTEEEPIRK